MLSPPRTSLGAVAADMKELSDEPDRCPRPVLGGSVCDATCKYTPEDCK